ncbi:MAG: hypothetical protein IKC45_07180, partial [Clostridia bacterium]|nr:hypothetical protein [Clostridia bacterium]
MQRTKKFLSVVLSVIMLLSVFTSSVSAAAPVLTGSQGSGIGYGFFAEDGTTEISSVKAGDKVTVKVYATSAYDNDIIQTLGFQLWYDNTVYTYLPETFTWGPEFVTLLDTTLSKAEKITSATGVAYTNVFNAMT